MSDILKSIRLVRQITQQNKAITDIETDRQTER